jgi:hypothetical protein
MELLLVAQGRERLYPRNHLLIYLIPPLTKCCIKTLYSIVAAAITETSVQLISENNNSNNNSSFSIKTNLLTAVATTAATAMESRKHHLL